MIAIVWCLRRRRTDILDVGESTLDVGEQTVGETTRRRNHRNSLEEIDLSFGDDVEGHLSFGAKASQRIRCYSYHELQELPFFHSKVYRWTLEVSIA